MTVYAYIKGGDTMIGDKIKLLREAKGLTQQQIAQDPAFGIKQGTLSAYERNAREPNIETIRKIAEYFGVTSDYLLGISEHQTVEHDAIGKVIPLSDAAIDFLRTYDDAMLSTISSVLSASAAAEFFEDLRAYVMACCPEPEDLAELLPMADHLNRGAGADRVALEMLTSYKRKLLDRALDELCEELTRAAGPGGSSEITKGGTHYGNSSKTRG